MRKKKKRLFIESLEQRRSTSPLLVQTMSAGESGAIGIDGKDRGGASAEQLATKQSAKENLIKLKNDTLIEVNPKDPIVLKYGPGPKPPNDQMTIWVGEDGKLVRPDPKDPIVLKYGPGPKPPNDQMTIWVGEDGKLVRPDPKDPAVLKYGPGPKPPEYTTLSLGEEGKPVKPEPKDPVVLKYGPGPKPGSTMSVTTQVTKIEDSGSKKESVNAFVLRKIAELRNKIREVLNGPTERMGRNINVSVSKGPTLKKVTLTVGEDVNNPK